MPIRASNSPLCGVAGCNTPSRYKCPRCDLRYCNSSCYLAHSQYCVDSFTSSTSEPWKRRKVSEYERRRFAHIANRIYRAGFSTGVGYEDGILDHHDPAEEWEHEGQDSPVVEAENDIRGDSDASAEDEEDAVLLQRFMNDVGHEEKQLLFGLIHQDMRDQLIKQRGAQQGQQPALKPVPDGPKETSSASSPKSAQGDRVVGDTSSEQGGGASFETVTDALEQLAEEMEVTELTEEEILSRLPVCLAREFEQRVHRGEVEQMMRLWRPWWTIGESSREEDEREEEETGLPRLPVAEELRVPVELPRRRKCVGLIFNVVEVLIGYCHAMRMCNGEWGLEVGEVGRRIGDISGVLRDDARYGTMEEACGAAVRGVVERDKSRGAAVEALHDVAGLLAGGGEWVTRGLFECERILERAGKETGGRAGKEMRRWARKVGYFVSWGLGEGRGTFVQSSRKVLSCAEAEGGRCEEVSVAEKVMKMMKAERRKPLIQVIT